MLPTSQGTFLDVDLTTGTLATRDVPEEMLRTYLGGSGLAARLLYDELDPAVDPLAPEAPLAFINGLLVGTSVVCCNKICVCARSPLTGIWGEARAGGYFGAQLAKAGIGGIIFRGQAPDPVYLWIDEGKAELRPASHAWGKDTIETSDLLRAETHPKAQVGAIGPGGEAGVRFANVMFGGHDARAAGRTGMGAVMGSKRLKAIVVHGTGTVGVADPDGLRTAMRQANRDAREGAGRLREFGTWGGVASCEAAGDLPIMNWRLGSWPDGAEKVTLQANFERMFLRHYACFACPIRCGKIVRIPDGPHAGLEAHGAEYETAAGFGPLCLNDDPDTIVAANDLCNRYSLDTISTAAVIAFAMEANERGLLSPDDYGDIEPVWGSPEAILSLVHQIAHREGLGKLLGEGVRRAAETLGGDAPMFAIHTKGMEYPYHDPRAFISMAPSYATSSRGACHMDSFSYGLGYGMPMPDIGVERGSVEPHDHEGKSRLAVLMQDIMAVYDALGMCKFVSRDGTGPSRIAEWLNLATGWDVSPDELMATGERLFTLKRAYSIRCGTRRADDALPDRLEHLDRQTGAAAGSLPDMPRLLADYYALRHWDDRGFPAPSRLDALGLEAIAADLAALA